VKRVLIVGISGQDGTLLARLLKSQDVDYLGLGRKGVLDAGGNLLRAGSLTDADFIRDLIGSFLPTEIYYLAAHHHSSQDIGPARDVDLWRESLQVQVVGLVNCLEAIGSHDSRTKLFYASSSHIFGSSSAGPQTETSVRSPDNVYGLTKVSGMEACRYYRQKHGLFASVGILYNHESVYRQEKFLSQKIIRGALAIKHGRSRRLVLGDLSAQVDWGYALDYVDAMVRILALPQPDDFIVATGERHSVREFVDLAFREQGLDYTQWTSEDSSLVRPGAGYLVGDASKLRRETGWAPSVDFAGMVKRLSLETCTHFPELNE
jgi:GDPmannose 4,6-dehydratase